MNSLKEKIKNDTNQALKEKKAVEVSTLRMLWGAIKDKEIFLRKGDEVNLSDEQVIDVIMSEIKKRKDSVAAYTQGGRNDLADREGEEIKILEKYLPEQLSDEELQIIVKEAIAPLGAVSMKDFGKIMGTVMPKVKGKADGNKISEILKKVLQ